MDDQYLEVGDIDSQQSPKKKKKHLTTLQTTIGVLALSAALVTAVWMSGLISFTGDISSPGATEPSALVFAVDFTNLPPNCDIINTTSIDNTDGDLLYSFLWSENVVSTSGQCVYQEGIDYTVKLQHNGNPEVWLLNENGSIQQNVTLVSGWNDLKVHVQCHNDICPLSGTYQLNGSAQF